MIGSGIATAANVDHFIIQLWSNPIALNEPVDLTIKAVDKNSDIIKDYEGDVFIEVVGLNDKDVTLPNDGVYTFLPTDQWQKTFSKGTIIKKEGTFKVKASEVLNDKIQGTTDVVVSAHGSASNTGNLKIISPVVGSTETNNSVNVLWSSSFPNSPLEIRLDNKKVKDALTNTNGDFNIYVDGVTVGEHTLLIKVVDLNQTTLASSNDIAFKYQPSDTKLYTSVKLTPGNKINAGDKVRILISTDDTVSTAELTLQWGETYLMDRNKAGEFSKEIKVSKAGTYALDLKLTAGTQSKTYPTIETLNVLATTTTITNIKYLADPSNPLSLNVSWNYQWVIAKFKVSYGSNSKQLDISKYTTTPSIAMTLTPGQPLYLQIQWLDVNGSPIGSPSEMILVEPLKGSGWPQTTCIVDGIKLNSIVIGDKHYLSRNRVAGIDRYIVYKSDTETKDLTAMTKVGETSDDKFEYPYDPNASQEQYVYYAIQAVCADGSKITLNDIKKVKVWPRNTVFYVGLIATLFYGSLRVLRNNE